MTKSKVPSKGFPALRAELLRKEKKTRQWLSAEVAKRTRRAPMSVAVAQAIVAHDHGLVVSRYLSGQDLTDVQHAMRDLNATPTSVAAISASKTNGRRTSRAVPSSAGGRVMNFKGAKVVTRDPFLPTGKLDEARSMANVYPLLYVLENSIREVIRRVMTARFGDDWWNTQMAGGRLVNLVDKVAARMSTEKRHSWHQRRGAHPIDYTDFEDLLTIAQGKTSVFFPQLLGDQDWFRQFFREVIPSRNVVCHMNPLSDTNAADIGIKLQRWEQHLTAQRGELEAAIAPGKAVAS
jgi:hypothetical protein